MTLPEIIERVRAQKRHQPVPGDLELPAAALRGSFKEFIEYARPVTGANPAHLFGAWWAVLAACIGSKRQGTWNGKVVPLTYAVAMGPTGDHKTTAMDLAVELLPQPAVKPVSGSTSDAGLFDALEDAAGSAVLLHYDEIGFLLKMASLSGSSLDSMLNRLWNAPAYLDRNLSRRATNGGARRVERPFACLLAGTHPETFWQQLGDPALAIGSGFVNRLAIFLVDRATSLDVTEEPDPTVMLRLRDHLSGLTKLPASAVTLATTAVEIWKEFSRDQDAQTRDLPRQQAAVTKRVRDHVARLALTYATDAGRTTIGTDELVAAIEVGAYLQASYFRLLLGQQARYGPARASDLEAIVLHLLGKRPAVWQSPRDLVRAWPNADRPSTSELRRILDSLDEVEFMLSGTRKVYRLCSFVHDTRHTTPRNQSGRVSGVG